MTWFVTMPKYVNELQRGFTYRYNITRVIRKASGQNVSYKITKFLVRELRPLLHVALANTFVPCYNSGRILHLKVGGTPFTQSGAMFLTIWLGKSSPLTSHVQFPSNMPRECDLDFSDRR